MLHESSNGKIAVVGILYKLGRPDSFLSSVSIYFPKPDHVQENHTKHVSFSLSFFFFFFNAPFFLSLSWVLCF
jgi:hypothetical protein